MSQRAFLFHSFLMAIRRSHFCDFQCTISRRKSQDGHIALAQSAQRRGSGRTSRCGKDDVSNKVARQRRCLVIGTGGPWVGHESAHQQLTYNP
jgi:hypothetical protein